MNKVRGNLEKILIIVLLMLTVIPINSVAKTKNVSDSTKDNAKCGNRVGIKITADRYNRVAGKNASGYYNTVSDRNVTISGNGSYTYTLYQYTADIGELEEMEDLTFKTTRGNDIQSTATDFNGSMTISVSPGKEVLLVVVLKSKNNGSTNVSTSGNCETGLNVTTKNSEGKDEVRCCTGYFFKKNSDSDSVDIGGVAASKFIQNPDGNDLYVQNLRKAGVDPKLAKACTNARAAQGTGEYSQFSINDPVLKQKWNDQYYSKLLSYCEAGIVPFNLDEDDIEKISNELLKLAFYANKLEAAGTTNIESINQKINDIKNKLDSSHFYIQYSNGKKEGNRNVLGSKLSCDYTNLFYNEELKTNQYKEGFGQEEYLYAQSSKKTARIKTKKHPKKGENVVVCETACYEHLTVVYSPPQVVKSGLCFQYKVTVKSETDCGVRIGDFAKKLDEFKDMCSPNPVCENEETKTQAGPNDEFDRCINSCDGGKYSQDCINQCYKKVYSNGSTKNKNKINSQKEVTTKVNYMNSISNKQVVHDLTTNQFNFSNLVTNISYTKKQLEDYAGEPYSKCTTDYIIKHGNYSECGKYYFQAKTLYPKGTYECDSNQNCTWNPEIEGPSKINSTDIESIGKQIARSSPFYVRSENAATELIKNLINANGRANYKYYISSNGIKTLASKYSSYRCGMNCSYHGCSDSDALTSEEYTSTLRENLEIINAKLKECNTSSACDTSNGETISEFKINVTSNRDSGETPTEIAGTNHLGSTTGDTNNEACPDKNPKPSMFVPANTDDKNKTQTGILGLCYDGTTARPQYQTTITFPGSWINLKTGEVNYDCQALTENRVKEQYYCTPYDSQDINVDWWKWALFNKYNGTAPKPDDNGWNITSSLGTEEKGFGKYRWHLGFQCFYALYNQTCEGDECSDEKCYRGDDGTEESCADEPDGSKKESTKTNYDIRVASLDSLFPKNRLRGYNWGSAATLKSDDLKVKEKLKSGGYDINPVEYSNTLIKNVGGKGEEGTYQEDQLDFRITLSDQDISYLKGLSLDFGGTYNKNDEIIPGLYPYTMDRDITSHFGQNIRKWQIGTNNK